MRLPVLGALLLVGPAVAADPSVEELFPLSVGKSWTYRVSAGAGPSQPERFTIRVAGEDMVRGANCFRLEATLGDRGVVATEYVGLLTSDGLCRFKIEKEEVTPPVVFLKPLKDGKRVDWGVASYQIGSRSAAATFYVEPANVRWKGKTYKGVRVVGDSSGEAGGRKSTNLYAPGIGLVQQRIEGEAKRPPLVLDLEEIDKKEPAK